MPTQETTPVLETQKISVKIPLASGSKVDLDAFVPVFHGWIQQQAVQDHLLVDVANYKHVVDGPGVLLIAHQANIGIDQTDGVTGLLYMRKQPIEQSFAKRIGQVVGYALELAGRIEAEPGLGLSFDRGRLILRLHDRLRAPNTPETFEAIRSTLTDALSGALGEKVTLEHRHDPERLLEVHVTRG